jgi:hypothetical protein
MGNLFYTWKAQLCMTLKIVNLESHDDESSLGARALPPATASAWLPPVDILESKDAYLIRAELPGMKKEDFNLEVNDGTLTLSGERKSEGLSNDVEYHRTERVHGRFRDLSICRRPLSRTVSGPPIAREFWKSTCPKSRKPSLAKSLSA